MDNLDFSFNFGTMGAADPDIQWIQKRKKGRPKKEIDKRQFEALIICGYTEIMAAEFLKVSDTTIQTWIKKEYGKTFVEIKREVIQKHLNDIRKKDEKQKQKAEYLVNRYFNSKKGKKK